MRLWTRAPTGAEAAALDALVQRGVAGAHGLVQHGEGLRHAEVVVHRGGEAVRHGGGDAQVVRVVLQRAHGALEEGADALQCRLGLVEG